VIGSGFATFLLQFMLWPPLVFFPLFSPLSAFSPLFKSEFAAVSSCLKTLIPMPFEIVVVLLFSSLAMCKASVAMVSLLHNIYILIS
jgi:hypothetical protein